MRKLKVEIRSDKVVIDGYVNVTDRYSRPLSDGKGGFFIEKIEQGAFKRAIEQAEEIKCLLNHDWNRVLGSTKTNMKLKEDIIGLRATVEITDPEVIEKAKQKRLRGWSFRFYKPKDSEETRSDGIHTRSISEFEMDEVSIIDERMRPCYESTTVEARGGSGEEIAFEVRAEEFDVEYAENEKRAKYDNSALLKLIEELRGKEDE